MELTASDNHSLGDGRCIQIQYIHHNNFEQAITNGFDFQLYRISNMTVVELWSTINHVILPQISDGSCSIVEINWCLAILDDHIQFGKFRLFKNVDIKKFYEFLTSKPIVGSE